jgi:hypothetical protein
MATTNIGVGRTYDDVFQKIASGWVTASPSAIASGSMGSVTITVPGVAADGSWEVTAETTNAPNLNVAGVIFYGTVSAANTVTLTIFNISGGSITPTAGSKYIVICGQMNPRFYT